MGSKYAVNTRPLLAQNAMRIPYALRSMIRIFPRNHLPFSRKCILWDSLPKPVSKRRAQQICISQVLHKLEGLKKNTKFEFLYNVAFDLKR